MAFLMKKSFLLLSVVFTALTAMALPPQKLEVHSGLQLADRFIEGMRVASPELSVPTERRRLASSDPGSASSRATEFSPEVIISSVEGDVQ